MYSHVAVHCIKVTATVTVMLLSVTVCHCYTWLTPILFLPSARHCPAQQDITHERAWLSSHVAQVVLKVVVETSGPEHTQDLFDHLEKEGYDVLQHPMV